MDNLLMAFVAGLATTLLVLGVIMIAASAYVTHESRYWKRRASQDGRKRAMQEWRDVNGRR